MTISEKNHLTQAFCRQEMLWDQGKALFTQIVNRTVTKLLTAGPGGQIASGYQDTDTRQQTNAFHCWPHFHHRRTKSFLLWQNKLHGDFYLFIIIFLTRHEVEHELQEVQWAFRGKRPWKWKEFVLRLKRVIVEEDENAPTAHFQGIKTQIFVTSILVRCHGKFERNAVEKLWNFAFFLLRTLTLKKPRSSIGVPLVSRAMRPLA